MKILIIQQKMIGDVLASSILFEAIKHQYPDAELHYVLNEHTYPVVEENPFIDQFHFFTSEHEKSKSSLWQFANQLRQENYDVIIDVYSQLSSNIITLRSKSKIKISKYKWYSSFIYSHTFLENKTPKTNAGLSIENRLELLTPLHINSNKVFKPKIYLKKSEKKEAKEFLQSHNIDLALPLIMIAVLGSADNKTYPPDYMAEIIDKIVIEQPKSQILFNYIPKQVADAKHIFELCAVKSQKRIFFEVFGKNLREFLAITSHCNALIGNEGGATNMAKALSIPTFTIFSPWIIKEAWNMFDDGKKHVSVHLNDYDTSSYSSINHPKELKPKATQLYKDFKPSFFKKELKSFLDELT